MEEHCLSTGRRLIVAAGCAALAVFPCAALTGPLDDPERCEQLAVAGRIHAREQFDLRRSSLTLKGWFDAVGRDSREPCVSSA